jgi:hypothetical protein
MMAMDIRNMSRKELGYISLLPPTDNAELSLRRRRLLSDTTNADPPDTNTVWQQEERDMANEVKGFFAQQQQYGQLNNPSLQSQELKQTLDQTVAARTTLLRQGKDAHHRQLQDEQQFQGPNANCTDPNASLPCPPEDLPLLCDKYRGGNFESCYQSCKPSYCCAHDSQSETVSPSCALTEVNCRHYVPCFIVWWRLADSIGPPVYITALQEDDFFDVDVNYLQQDFNLDPTFSNQLFQHHTDDDTIQNTDFFENPDNWV